ncbi:MAG: hypothetical protein RSF40_05635 [Oscillospiraceae bacterium]
MKLSKKILPVLVATMVMFSSATISFAKVDIDPKGGKDEHFFEKNGWHWEDWTKQSHDAMLWNDLDSEMQKEILKTKDDYDRALVQAEIDARASAAAATKAAEKSKQASEAEDNFWDKLLEQINKSKSGEYVAFDAGNYREMPAKIMEALKDKKVGLIVKYDGTVQFIIPADGTLEIEKGRVFYRLSDLCTGYSQIDGIVSGSLANSANDAFKNAKEKFAANYHNYTQFLKDQYDKTGKNILESHYGDMSLDTAKKNLGLTTNPKDISVATVTLASLANTHTIFESNHAFYEDLINNLNVKLVIQNLKDGNLKDKLLVHDAVLNLGNNGVYFSNTSSAIPASYGNVSDITHSYVKMLETAKKGVSVCESVTDLKTAEGTLKVSIYQSGLSAKELISALVTHNLKEATDFKD